MLSSETLSTLVPAVQPSGTLFYRAKYFFKRNLWNFIFEWDKNLFRFMVKHIHSSTVGRPENCNMLVAHIQYIGKQIVSSRKRLKIIFTRPWFDGEPVCLYNHLVWCGPTKAGPQIWGGCFLNPQTPWKPSLKGNPTCFFLDLPFEWWFNQIFVGRSLCHHLLHGPRLHGPVCKP